MNFLDFFYLRVERGDRTWKSRAKGKVRQWPLPAALGPSFTHYHEQVCLTARTRLLPQKLESVSWL